MRAAIFSFINFIIAHVTWLQLWDHLGYDVQNIVTHIYRAQAPSLGCSATYSPPLPTSPSHLSVLQNLIFKTQVSSFDTDFFLSLRHLRGLTSCAISPLSDFAHP